MPVTCSSVLWKKPDNFTAYHVCLCIFILTAMYIQMNSANNKRIYGSQCSCCDYCRHRSTQVTLHKFFRRRRGFGGNSCHSTGYVGWENCQQCRIHRHGRNSLVRMYRLFGLSDFSFSKQITAEVAVPHSKRPKLSVISRPTAGRWFSTSLTSHTGHEQSRGRWFHPDWKFEIDPSRFSEMTLQT